MIVVTLTVGLLGCVLLLQTLSDVLSLLKVLVSRTPERNAPIEVSRLLVLVPAHNEEMMIAACIRSLLGMRYPEDQFTVIVIADNCDDRTAEVARAAGTRCLERKDPLRPGKPAAIAWALGQLSLNDYDAVIIVDADTVVDAGFAGALARRAPLREKAVQAYYDVENTTENALTRLAAVLAAANHRFAYPFKQRAALNTPLVGNGMCIGTSVLLTHGWKAFSIAEDWEMYALLTERGVPIQCAPDAVVYAQETHTLHHSMSQRQRWTAGKLTVLVRTALPLLRSKHIGPRQKLDAVAELSSPGPALQLGLCLVGIGAVLLLRLPREIVLAFLGSLVRPVAYTALALRAQSDRAKAVAAFAFLPLYALWRLAAALSALRMLGDKPWIRTERHQHPTAGSTPR